MPFFQIPEESPSNDGLEFATKLADIIKQNNKFAKRISVKQWSSHFHKMTTADKISKERISKALDWYQLNIGKQYTPQILSGKSFRSKFLQLEQAITRTSSDNSSVEISPETKKLVEECKQIFSWPKGSSEDLPVLVQLSSNKYRPFYKAGIDWIVDYTSQHGNESLSWPVETRRLMTYVQLFFGNPNDSQVGILSSPNSFLKKWLGLISSRVKNWRDWDGNLNFFIFRLDHPMFLRILKEAVSNYSGSQDEVTWKKVITIVQEKMK